MSETPRTLPPPLISLEFAVDEASVGPKAASLARLARAGLPVPDGFCVPTAEYAVHLRNSGTKDLLSALDPCDTDPASLADIRRSIVAAPLRPDLAGPLRQTLAGFGATHLAVRSSATAEDLPGHSFAGQHGTYFAADIDECLQHVKHCWASLFSQRAWSYRCRAGLAGSNVSMAVIVQRLVDAQSSGVAFTADPATGRADRVVVESCFGLGEALVSGHVTPDRHVFTRPGLELLERTIAAKTTEVVALEAGRVEERAVDTGQAELPAISEARASDVAALAVRVEEDWAVPVDVEWCVANGETWLLQARPVTTRTGPSLQADRDLTVWTNANTGEVLPGVVTPMTWSVVDTIVDDILSGTFRMLGIDFGDNVVARLIAGRAYFNINVLASAFERVPVIGGSVNFTETFGGHQSGVDLPPDLVRHHVSGVTVGRLGVWPHLPVFILWTLRHGRRWGERFCARSRADSEATIALLKTGPGEETIARELHARLEGLHYLAEGVTSAAASLSNISSLTSISKRWLDDEDGAIATALLAGQGGVQSAEAGLAMWELAAWARKHPGVRETLLSPATWEELRTSLKSTEDGRDFLGRWDAFMVEHGHHSRAELELANPRWNERPDYVLRQVRRYLEMPDQEDPTALMHVHAVHARDLAASCRRRLGPLRRVVFDWTLRNALGGSVLRENIKSEGVRYMAAIRKLLLAQADLLVERDALRERDDIFFLTLEELEGVRRGETEATASVARGREEFERNRALSPPPVIVGEYDPRAQPVRRSTPGSATTLPGIAVSAGIAEGPARVFVSLDSDETVLPGEILVAPFTDPGWTPYFIPAAGIVMDMGGMLSHGSIIAREYGIPAVVNVGNATRIISTGQLIRVDGDRGEVSVL